MAESAAATTPADASPAVAARPRRRLVIIAALLVVVGAAVALQLLRGADAAPEAPTVPEEGAVVPVAELTAGVDGGAHFARVEFAAVLVEGVDGGAVSPRFPLLQDAALRVVMGMSADELATVAGADRLRERLTSEAHRLYPDGEVSRIVLTELLVQ